MKGNRSFPEQFHCLCVGFTPALVDHLLDPIARKAGIRLSYLLHPRFTRDSRPDLPPREDFTFFRDALDQPMPAVDSAFLASLECDGVPTVHNMILGDSALSAISYIDAKAYGTLIAKRLMEVCHVLEPSVVLTAFDGLHSSMALAVARRLGIPCFALHFSVIPPGLACFVDAMSPAARVTLQKLDDAALRRLAERALEGFEKREVTAAAYVAPPQKSLVGKLISLPSRAVALTRTFERYRKKKQLRYTEPSTAYDVLAVFKLYWRAHRARTALAQVPTLKTPPGDPYVLFGLHMQPESSIDVWAPYFSNQLWVIELLARSIPASHRLLVKIHKSDVSNYSRQQINRMRSLPNVEVVEPFVDTRRFIEQAALIVSIQGTMGLEGALLGKPVIMLGDSPVRVFPNAAQIGELPDLPSLIREKLSQPAPSRQAIIDAFASYLGPFMPASLNDWTVPPTSDEIAGYADLFGALVRSLDDSQSVAMSLRT